jgi:hypothetical protein
MAFFSAHLTGSFGALRPMISPPWAILSCALMLSCTPCPRSVTAAGPRALNASARWLRAGAGARLPNLKSLNLDQSRLSSLRCRAWAERHEVDGARQRPWQLAAAPGGALRGRLWTHRPGWCERQAAACAWAGSKPWPQAATAFGRCGCWSSQATPLATCRRCQCTRLSRYRVSAPPSPLAPMAACKLPSYLRYDSLLAARRRCWT